MAIISVEVSDAAMMALEFTGEDPQKWLEKAIKERAQFSMQHIARIYRCRAKEDSVEIPKSLDDIVQDAFDRGWLATEI